MWKLSMEKTKLLSFLSSSFETVVHMLQCIIIHSTESRATAAADVSDLD